MKTAYFGILLSLLVVFSIEVNAQYYYGLDGPISLNIDSSKVLVKFESSVSGYLQSALIDSIGRIIDASGNDLLIDYFVQCSLSTGTGYDAFLDSLDNVESIYWLSRFIQWIMICQYRLVRPFMPLSIYRFPSIR